VNAGVRVSIMDDSFDTVALAMGRCSREESLFDQDDDETDGDNDRSFVSRDEEEHPPPPTTPTQSSLSVSQTPAIPIATTTSMEFMWMNRFVSWWRGASQSSPGNLALLHCGIDTTTKAPEDPSLDERLAWNQAVAKLLRRSKFLTPAAGSRTKTTSNLYKPIPHVRQVETWDCGVACLQMAWMWLNDSPSCSASSRSIQTNTTNSTDTDTDDSNTMEAANTGDHNNHRDWMLQQLQTQSVWTVDLVLLLDHLIRSSGGSSRSSIQQEVSFLFSSNTLQVNETLGDIGYYRAAFLEDQRRVREHFEEIKRRQLLTVLQRCLPLEQIVALVQEPDCIAICLVDNVVLLAHDDNENVDDNDKNTGEMICTVDTTDGNHAGRQQQQHLHGVDDTYAGHYILLQGTSCQDYHLQQAGGTSIDAGYCFVVQNPGCSGTTYLSPDRFERAWRAKGTDEDILFVAKHNI
jgi:hypothetical protein